MNGLRIVAVALSCAVIVPAVEVTADSYQSYPAYGYPSSSPSCNGHGTTAELSCYGPLASPCCSALPCAPQLLPSPAPAPPTCFPIPCVSVPCCRPDLGGLVSAPCPSRCPVPCAPRPPGPRPVPCASPSFAPPPSPCSPWPGATTACYSPAAGYALLAPRRSPGGPRREPVLRAAAPKARRTPRPVPLKLRPYPRTALPPPTSPCRYGYDMTTTLSALARLYPSAFSSTYGRYE